MADKTAKKLPAHKDPSKHFKPGQKSANPSGRPKGSRNKLGEAFLSDLLADWEAHGAEVIESVRADKPEVYMKVVASILPKDLNVNVNKFEELSDEELKERLRDLYDAISPFVGAEGSGGDSSGTEPPTAH